jgi:hypothetical protein
MLAWGWRLPFLLALPPGLLAAWGRSSFPESELFSQESQLLADEIATQRESDDENVEIGRKVPSSQRAEDEYGHDWHVMKTYWPSILLGFAAPAAGATSLYVSTMWCLSYLRSLGMASRTSLLIGSSANIVAIITTPVFAHFADIHGVAFMLIMGGVGMLTTGLPGVALLVAYPGNGFVAFLCIGICYGCVRGLYTNTFYFCAELFPTVIRSRGLGLGLNIGVTLFGGFGGLLAQASLSISSWGPGHLMSATGAITILAGLWSLRLRRLGYPVAHRRKEPYFGAIRGPNGEVKVESAALQNGNRASGGSGPDEVQTWTEPAQWPKLMSIAWRKEAGYKPKDASKPEASTIGHVAD